MESVRRFEGEGEQLEDLIEAMQAEVESGRVGKEGMGLPFGKPFLLGRSCTDWVDWKRALIINMFNIQEWQSQANSDQLTAKECGDEDREFACGNDADRCGDLLTNCLAGYDVAVQMPIWCRIQGFKATCKLCVLCPNPSRAVKRECSRDSPGPGCITFTMDERQLCPVSQEHPEPEWGTEGSARGHSVLRYFVWHAAQALHTDALSTAAWHKRFPRDTELESGQGGPYHLVPLGDEESSGAEEAVTAHSEVGEGSGTREDDMPSVVPPVVRAGLQRGFLGASPSRQPVEIHPVVIHLSDNPRPLSSLWRMVQEGTTADPHFEGFHVMSCCAPSLCLNTTKKGKPTCAGVAGAWIAVEGGFVPVSQGLLPGADNPNLPVVQQGDYEEARKRLARPLDAGEEPAMFYEQPGFYLVTLMDLHKMRLVTLGLASRVGSLIQLPVTPSAHSMVEHHRALTLNVTHAMLWAAGSYERCGKLRALGRVAELRQERVMALRWSELCSRLSRLLATTEQAHAVPLSDDSVRDIFHGNGNLCMLQEHLRDQDLHPAVAAHAYTAVTCFVIRSKIPAEKWEDTQPHPVFGWHTCHPVTAGRQV